MLTAFDGVSPNEFGSSVAISGDTAVVGTGSEQTTPSGAAYVFTRSGATWSLQQKWRSMGKIGEYLKRLRWLRLGQARQWVFEVRITDPIPRVIIAAHADYVKGYT